MMLMICDTLYKTSPRGQFYKKKILPLCVFFLPRYNHSLKRRHFYTIADVLEYIKEKKKGGRMRSTVKCVMYRNGSIRTCLQRPAANDPGKTTARMSTEGVTSLDPIQ